MSEWLKNLLSANIPQKVKAKIIDKAYELRQQAKKDRKLTREIYTNLI